MSDFGFEAPVADRRVSADATSVDGDPIVHRYDTDGDGRIDRTTVDFDRDGTPEIVETDSDEDGQIDDFSVTTISRSNVVGLADMDGDRHFETVMRDFDGDGRPDRFDYDRDGDSVADEVAFDSDGDGEPDLLLDELTEIRPDIAQAEVQLPAGDRFAFGTGQTEAADPDLEAREADAYREALADSVRMADPGGPPDVYAAPAPDPAPLLGDLAEVSDIDDALADDLDD